MKDNLSVAVVGATGAVGRCMLEVLSERQIPISRCVALASARSEGEFVPFGDDSLMVENVSTFDFQGIDVALFSAGSQVASEFAPKATAVGAWVIDNSSCFRNEEKVPLVIPEINADALDRASRGIIANPNCSTIAMLVAAFPIEKAVGIERMDVSTYQSVSGAGQKGIAELVNQSVELLNGHLPDVEHFPAPIAFNVIPEIDIFMENGYTKEEMKMLWESRKILSRGEDLVVNATCVRVPVLYGHSLSITLTAKEPLDLKEVCRWWSEAPFVVLADDFKKSRYPTPRSVIGNEDAVYIGRVRQDIADPRRMNFWVVADNVRKGAALNAIQILEALYA